MTSRPGLVRSVTLTAVVALGACTSAGGAPSGGDGRAHTIFLLYLLRLRLRPLERGAPKNLPRS